MKLASFSRTMTYESWIYRLENNSILNDHAFSAPSGCCGRSKKNIQLCWRKVVLECWTGKS